MPPYTLAPPEAQVVTSWLFEPDGYLDFAVRSGGPLDGQTARQALAADPTLDVTQWVRANPQQDPAISNEVALVWWIRVNHGVNIPPPARPPEAASWVAILQEWDSSINAGFADIPKNQRNVNTVPIYGEDGALIATMPAGAQLAHQQSLISKVLSVLQ